MGILAGQSTNFDQKGKMATNRLLIDAFKIIWPTQLALSRIAQEFGERSNAHHKFRKNYTKVFTDSMQLSPWFTKFLENRRNVKFSFIK